MSSSDLTDDRLREITENAEATYQERGHAALDIADFRDMRAALLAAREEIETLTRELDEEAHYLSRCQDDLNRAEAEVARLREYVDASEAFWTGSVDEKAAAIPRLKAARAALAPQGELVRIDEAGFSVDGVRVRGAGEMKPARTDDFEWGSLAPKESADE